MNNRYSRQILFSEIGKAGQKKLSEARVLLIGCGALGASHAEMLARAGVGFLRIVDRDFVEFSNLQRQTLYSESDATERLPKVIAAKNRLTEINSEIEIDAIIADVNNSNIENILEDIDLVFDGTDNFQIRYLINDACVKLGKTWIYGAAVSSYGTSMTIIPGRTPCLRCIFEEMPAAGTSPTCDTAGVIQPIISTISAIQVSEGLKILVGKTEKLHGSIVQVDMWENDWRKIKVGKPSEDCKTCGKRVFEFLEASNRDLFTSLCGRDAVQIRPPNSDHIDLARLAALLEHLDEVKLNEYLLRFRVDGFEITVFQDARAIIRGTDDPMTARSVYAKYIGS
ncbi:MAG: ThiF family adenylyltransferase [Acidobacteria bacterium]|nr:ThiF family adenylyltransferase [Acidobacteriota bacterium]